MIFFSSVFTLVHREWKRFLRQKSRVLSSILTPILFWVVMGAGFGKSFSMPFANQGYLEYFFPGILMMTLLFSAIFSMISLIEDRNEGFLQSVMVSPVSHTAIVLGKILGATTLSVAQTLIILPLAKLAGLSFDFAIASELFVVFFLSGIFLCSVSFLFAWLLNSSQGFHAVMNILLLPMWLLSGAMFPMENSSRPIQWIMYYNPLTYAMRAIPKNYIHGCGPNDFIRRS